MFVDLVGSTALSEHLDLEDFGEVIAAYQATCRACVESWSGFAARTFGDGLLVYFGYPRAIEDAAYRAVRAGREIVREVPRLTDRCRKRLPILAENPLGVRVGIHTGLVVVGDITTGGTEEHVARGEAMNIAARLQGVAEPNQVVISDATLRLVPGLFLIRDLGTPSLKGVTEPIRAYAVSQPTGIRSRLDVHPRLLTRLVGRDEDMERLAALWAKVQAGAGQTVLLGGEPGVGKSRLLLAVRERLAGQPHTWLECHSTPYTQGSAFYPLIELIERALELSAGDSAETKLRRLERALERADLSAPDTVPLIAPLLSLQLPDQYPPRQEGPLSSCAR